MASSKDLDGTLPGQLQPCALAHRSSRTIAMSRCPWLGAVFSCGHLNRCRSLEVNFGCPCLPDRASLRHAYVHRGSDVKACLTLSRRPSCMTDTNAHPYTKLFPFTHKTSFSPSHFCDPCSIPLYDTNGIRYPFPSPVIVVGSGHKRVGQPRRGQCSPQSSSPVPHVQSGLS